MQQFALEHPFITLIMFWIFVWGIVLIVSSIAGIFKEGRKHD